GDDVAAADQLAVDPQLREGRPVGVLGQLGADFRILQDVHVGELFAATHHRLGGARGEAALRGVGRALHVQQDGVVGDLLFDGFDDIHEGHLGYTGSADPRAGNLRGIVTESRVRRSGIFFRDVSGYGYAPCPA